MRALLRWLLLAALACLGVVGGSTAAPGTFPGKNGPIVFDAVLGTGNAGTVQIYRISGSGTGMKQLTKKKGQIWNQDPVWSASGKTIYFASANRQAAAPTRVYRMRATGAGRQRVSKTSANWPSPNKAGSMLAYTGYGKGGKSVIATMKANGTGAKVIATPSGQASNFVPEYAPSGTRLVFAQVTFSGGNPSRGDLFVRTGTKNTNITSQSSAIYYGASWSPNGQTLAAIQGQGTIVSMTPSGTNVKVLTSVSGGQVADLVYSPDGTKIAFLQCTGDCGDPHLQGQGSIWVMNNDGSGKKRIFNGRKGLQPASRISWGSS